MKVFARIGLAATLLACTTVMAAPSAHALTAKECHEKFKEAKADGSLKDQTYKAFKTATCDAAQPEATKATETKAAEAKAPEAKPAETKAAETASTAKPLPTSAEGAVFPSAVSAQYSKLSAGKARQKTCLDQYNANKANNANGGLKWIQKGGGYYSVCNTRLKG
ncbi:hypothetical protein [Acetobacter papayae]|uniref:hypothetical protein n=1 Tax=Acetobacter papayae TaxID=1076592 RepID=UPI0039EAC376